MNVENPNIPPNRPVIRQLDDAAANRIAAGEVVERPSSAIKELVENAIDARATRIDIAYADGGKTLIRVTDDGHGIPQDQMILALSRHATSKIDGSDLLNIHTFGFRGEALPSMGAVGRLTITSRVADADIGATITVNGGEIGPLKPAPATIGTVVELRDLFHATPARLKFLRARIVPKRGQSTMWSNAWPWPNRMWVLHCVMFQVAAKGASHFALIRKQAICFPQCMVACAKSWARNSPKTVSVWTPNAKV